MRNFLTFSFLIFFTMSAMAQTEMKLIYIADPMCSWCYGFSPELTKVKEQTKNKIDFEIVMGGLRPYNTETMTDLGDFLKEHWEEVSKRSGQEFDYSILKDASFVYDTEPACRAVAIVREMAPTKAYDFFKAVQIAFYKNNKNTNQVETYLDLLSKFNIDKTDFKKAFESSEWKEKIKEDFQHSANLGVRGFPTLILQKGKELYLLSNGYRKAEEILSAISKVSN